MSKKIMTAKLDEKPILFSGPLVRAILDGVKTETRRLIKGTDLWLSDPKEFYGLPIDDRPCLADPAIHHSLGKWYWFEREYPDEGATEIRCPFGSEGTKLWVRETWCYQFNCGDDRPAIPHKFFYRADPPDGDLSEIKWKPSLHMPRPASRITLLVKAVSVQRLQEMTASDAMAEGIREVSKDGGVKKYCVYDKGDHSSTPWEHMERDPVTAFKNLWNNRNIKAGLIPLAMLI